MKSERGSVNFDERTNTIIVTDTTGQIATIDQVITKLDKTTPQVLIEAKIVETTFVDTENLGVNWITQATISGSQRPIIGAAGSGESIQAPLTSRFKLMRQAK